MTCFQKSIADRRGLIAIVIAIAVLLASIGAGFGNSKAGFHKSKHRHRTCIQKILVIQEATRAQHTNRKCTGIVFQQSPEITAVTASRTSLKDYYNPLFLHDFILSSLSPRASPLA